MSTEGLWYDNLINFAKIYLKILTEIEIKIYNFRFLLITIHSILVKLEFSFMWIPDSLLVSKDNHLPFTPCDVFSTLTPNTWLQFPTSISPILWHQLGHRIQFNSILPLTTRVSVVSTGWGLKPKRLPPLQTPATTGCPGCLHFCHT